MSEWTAEHDLALRKAIAEGATYSQAASAINREFGTAFTRNAAIGRGGRLHLLTRTTASWQEARARRIRLAGQARPHGDIKPRAPQTKAAAPVLRAAKIPVGSVAARAIHAIIHKRESAIDALEKDRRPLRCVAIEPRHVSLLDLQPGECRWPHGEGPFTFCGHATVKDRSYCAAHAELALSRDPRAGQARDAATVAKIRRGRPKRFVLGGWRSPPLQPGVAR